MRVLTEDQQLLTDYLTASGMPLIERMLVVTELWEPEATQEMFQRIAETGERKPAQLSKIASEISHKYKRNME
jgi:hypothetical protein